MIVRKDYSNNTMPSLLLFFTSLLVVFSSLQGKVYLEIPEEFNSKMDIVGCFLEWEDKVLFLHRQDHKTEGNTWGIPGGKVDKSESPLEAVIREVKEETQFDISTQPIRYIGKVYIKYPTYDNVYYMFSCAPKEDPGSVKINFDEHKGFTWITPQNALQMELMLNEDDCIKLCYPARVSPND